MYLTGPAIRVYPAVLAVLAELAELAESHILAEYLYHEH